MPAAADAFYPDGPSCENAIQKSPQAFLNCKYKNFLPYYSQSERGGYF